MRKKRYKTYPAYLSKRRLLTVIAVFFPGAVVFYLFLYVVREGLRLLSITDTYDLWILSDSEVQAYNLLLAFLAVIFAQSACLTFLLNRPRRMYEQRNIMRTMVVHDQQFLNSYFISWFAKLVVVFALFFGFDKGFYAASISSNYGYIFILIVIVLFFQTRVTLWRLYRKNSIKRLLISLGILCAVSFGISRINIIDYTSINNTCLSNNTAYTYGLELPEVCCFEQHNRFRTTPIYLVLNSEGNPTIVDDSNRAYSFSDFKEMGQDLFSLTGSCHTYKLYIDRRIEMKYVNQLREQMVSVNAFRISYAVTPAQRIYDKRYYTEENFPFRLSNFTINPNASLQSKSAELPIVCLGSLTYTVNNRTVAASQLGAAIKNAIAQHPSYVVSPHYDRNLPFNDYMQLLTATKEAINKLRDEYSHTAYRKAYSKLSEDEQANVVAAIPFMWAEYPN